MGVYENEQGVIQRLREVTRVPSDKAVPVEGPERVRITDQRTRLNYLGKPFKESKRPVSIMGCQG